MIKQKTKNIVPVFIIFGIVFCLTSLVNHYLFRTYAYDLGINNNAMYDYAHFRVNDCMLLQPRFSNLLSDHFSLLTIPISFLYPVFGSYTLLLFQIFMILTGGMGIYHYFSDKYPDKNLGYWATVHFFVIWGIYSCLANDYHDNVAGAMFIPWLFVYTAREDLLRSSAVLALLIISKENVALWSVFVCIGIAIELRHKPLARRMCLIFSAACVLYFIIVVKAIMPSLANENRHYLHFNFNALGSDPGTALSNIISDPLIAVKLLFMNQIHNPRMEGFEFDDIKLELFYTFALSGGLLLVLRPQYLLMLIPIFGQKLFNDDVAKWGLNYHYSIELVPILTLGAFNVIGEMGHRLSNILKVAVVLSTAFMTGKSLDNRKSLWYKGKNHRFYTAAHYKRDFNVSDVYKSIRKIPENARLCAQSPIVPHVCFRDYIYLFPNYNDADYIIVNEDEDPYPYFVKAELIDELIRIKSNRDWELISKEGAVLIFRRTNLEK